jgi:two-component system response regulator ChvI
LDTISRPVSSRPKRGPDASPPSVLPVSDPQPRGTGADVAGAEGKSRLALVDDDPLFRESLAANLGDAGFEVREFPDGEAFLAGLEGETYRPDMVLLDWRMPGMNGIEVLRRLREEGLEFPVIFLTALQDQIYEETALSTGAVDYVEKSRSFGILLARINLIRGTGKLPGGTAEGDDSNDPPPLAVGDLELQPAAGKALWRGREIELTVTEFQMVCTLAERAGKNVRYRELYDLVHGKGFIAGDGGEGYRANMRTFMKRIRQKFRAADERFDQIENYPGFGYRWRRDDPKTP